MLPDTAREQLEVIYASSCVHPTAPLAVGSITGDGLAGGWLRPVICSHPPGLMDPKTCDCSASADDGPEPKALAVSYGPPIGYCERELIAPARV